MHVILLSLTLAGILLTPVLASAQVPAINLNCGRGGIPLPCFGANPQGPAGKATAGELIASALSLLLAVAAAIAVLFIIIGGIRYIGAQGNEEASEAAKKTLTNAVIGLVAVILAFAAVRVIATLLLTGRVGP